MSETLSTNSKSNFKYWEKFLESIHNTVKFDKITIDSNFDSDLYIYLTSLAYIAELDSQNLPTDDEIKEALLKITNFYNKYKDEYYEISLIKGFEDNSISLPSSRKDFYYYIADKKMKASVYYARYINFVQEFFEQKGKNEDRQSSLKELITQIEETSDSEEKKELLSTHNFKDLNDLKDNLQIQNLKCGKENAEEDYKYIKYILFNNVMREIRYIGAGYQYLWHWNTKKCNLYRATCTEDQLEENKPSKTKQTYLKKMFTNCIEHMNAPKPNTQSYSENCLLDIYKYLTPKKANSQTECFQFSENKYIKLMKEIDNSENCIFFYIIKNASINCIFPEINNPVSFQEFAINSKKEASYNYPYTVEIYPQQLEGERNQKGTTVGMRDKLLPNYLSSWLDCKDKLTLCKTKVADDKEVITVRKFFSDYDSSTPDDYKNCFKEAADGTRFCLKLCKEDIIYLLLNIATKKPKLSSNNIVECIINKLNHPKVWNFSLDGPLSDYWFKQFYEKQEDERVFYFNFKIDTININFQIKIDGNIFKQKPYTSDDGNRCCVSDAKDILKDTVVELICSYLCDRYNNILEKEFPKSTFILNTLNKEDYCFDLIKQYTEYNSNNADSEISMLKYLIFKEENL